MSETPDLLLLRLDALELDIGKVRLAVASALKRSASLQLASSHIRGCTSRLRSVKAKVDSLVEAMREDPEIEQLLDDTSYDLSKDLRGVPELVAGLLDSVDQTTQCLADATATTVPLDDFTLSASLNRRCNHLSEKLADLRTESLKDTTLSERRRHWTQYQVLLDVTARPLFAEYVDFLGGLTVRDTGLDDRVCEMTDAVLSRFKAITQRCLPLPARQAALGNALDSVVLLGFPEWSIWGIALVGHEVGLAYAKDQNDRDLVKLVGRWVEELTAGSPDVAKGRDAEADAEEFVHQVLADAFATYTLGLSYACAALLLRLTPRHDEPQLPDRLRDIDRARVIMMILTAGGDSAPAPFGAFTDAVEKLQEIWRAAVTAHAGPAQAGAALKAAEGPLPEDERLDDLAREAMAHFRRLTNIRPYDNERWKASDEWYGALRDNKPCPSWAHVDDTVPDVLTAAWRARLMDSKDAMALADTVKTSWSRRTNGSRR